LILKVRKKEFSFADVSPHYCQGDACRTHLLNALLLLFAEGEQFFIRSVCCYQEEIANDPELTLAVKGFCAQEMQHARSHEVFYKVLEKQGYEIRPFLATYERIAFELQRIAFESGERRASPLWNLYNLSVTVALEHFAAVAASRTFTTDLFEGVDSSVREFLRWHAAEEIEHKSVAFDVLKKVDGRYSIRVAGLFLGSLSFLIAWSYATWSLLRQEKKIGVRGLATEIFLSVLVVLMGSGPYLKAALDYLRPGFHPNETDDAGLAAAYFAETKA